jgi:hypothetical protein
LTLTGCVISNCLAIGGPGAIGIGSGSGGDGGNGYGGGIFNKGKLTLDRCWMVANQAAGGNGGASGILFGFGGNGGWGIGGGVYSVFATLAARGCTFSANRAIFGNAGGGVSGSGTNGSAAAAGLNLYSGTTMLINSTIASNVVSGSGSGVAGGMYSASGGIGLLACTVAGNNGESEGGGIGGFGGGSVTNSIIAGNSATSAPDASGAFASGGYNIIGNTSGNSGFGGTGDHLNVNPVLGPLQDNGGPTPTVAPRSGSPAIDQGKNFGMTVDQRGAPRPFDFFSIANAAGGDGSDIGPFELGTPSLKIQRAPGNNVVLSWPEYYGDFALESTNVLSPSNNWSTVSNAPVIVGSQFNVTNSASGLSKFYRLKRL